MDRAAIDIKEVKDLLKSAKRLAKTDFEKKFVADQEERLKKWGDDTWFSPKQIVVLRKIAGDPASSGDEEF